MTSLTSYPRNHHNHKLRSLPLLRLVSVDPMARVGVMHTLYIQSYNNYNYRVFSVVNVCMCYVAIYVLIMLSASHFMLLSSTAAPAGAPEMFVAAAGERQVTFSWSPPPVALRNGVITSYTLSCFPSLSSLPQSPSQPGPLTVAGFSPDTSYSCSVVASNSQGSGPPANTSFRTLEDCESIILLLLTFHMFLKFPLFQMCTFNCV